MIDIVLSVMGKNKFDCVIYYIFVLRELLICDSDQFVFLFVYLK